MSQFHLKNAMTLLVLTQIETYILTKSAIVPFPAINLICNRASFLIVINLYAQTKLKP